MNELPSNVTKEWTKCYVHENIALIRSRDVSKLASKHTTGACVNPYIQFGKWLLHMTCGRGFTEVVSFFVMDCEESIRIRDDYGRTPLHDAF